MAFGARRLLALGAEFGAREKSKTGMERRGIGYAPGKRWSPSAVGRKRKYWDWFSRTRDRARQSSSLGSWGGNAEGRGAGAAATRSFGGRTFVLPIDEYLSRTIDARTWRDRAKFRKELSTFESDDRPYRHETFERQVGRVKERGLLETRRGVVDV
ncbi:hypothetical protein KM043_012146 [Ampulex compressa]|nr:hypothetical protein KM043_012146 [Ampulex compressa]